MRTQQAEREHTYQVIKNNYIGQHGLTLTELVEERHLFEIAEQYRKAMVFSDKADEQNEKEVLKQVIYSLNSASEMLGNQGWARSEQVQAIIDNNIGALSRLKQGEQEKTKFDLAPAELFLRQKGITRGDKKDLIINFENEKEISVVALLNEYNYHIREELSYRLARLEMALSGTNRGAWDRINKLESQLKQQQENGSEAVDFFIWLMTEKGQYTKNQPGHAVLIKNNSISVQEAYEIFKERKPL